MGKLSNERPSGFDPRAVLAGPSKGLSTTRYRKTQHVFSQGQPADAVYYIQRGKVKITVVSDRGKEAVVSTLGTGDFFGEGCIAGQPVRISTVTTLTESSIMRLEKSRMLELLHDHAALSEMFTAHVLKRTIRVEADLIDQLFNSSERRLARLLLLLANYGQDGKPEPVLAKISQETLAAMIGTTRSRVSHFMNKFRKLGLLTYNGHITVHKSLLNLVLHEQPHIEP
jgi:CRP-like cAMP-binding protein